jgi:hypothetical protein
MDWQTLLVGLAVLAAVGYLGRRAWRTWGAKAGCAGGCHCSSSAQGPAGKGDAAPVTLIPAERLTLRRHPPAGGA